MPDIVIRNQRQLADVIRHVRTQSEIGVGDFAETVNVTPQYLWEMERAKPNLFVTRLFRIFARLGITVTLSFAGRDDSNSAEPNG
jgi:DNA-binding transcriptional regulator YiaG